MIFSLATENMRGLFLVTIISVALILEGSYGILNEEQIKEQGLGNTIVDPYTGYDSIMGLT